jgi:hypothetical protein
LELFNSKVPTPSAEAPVDIIQQDDSVPHIDLKGQKKTEQEEIAVDKELQQMRFDRYDIQNETKIIKAANNTNDGFDPDEHTYDTIEVKKPEPKDFLEEAQKEQAELNASTEQSKQQAQERKEELDKIIEQHEEPTIAEQIEEVMAPERIRPDFTEVIDTEQAVQEMMTDPKKAMEEDLQIVEEKARKSPLADMSKLAIEPEIGEFIGGYKPMFVKKSQEKIKKDAYIQNEEQTDKTNWKKIKTKLTSEDQYHEMQEKRIDQLMSRVDAGEIQIEDLTPEDRQVIIDIRMQNESGDKIN